MPSKYAIRDHQAPHFITFATVRWIDALSRPYQKEVVLDSLRYCQQHKGLRLFAYVIMSNHVHLIAAAADNFSLSNILRDLKRHTSRQLLDLLQNDLQESRRDWMLWLCQEAAARNSNNQLYQFWQQDNHPIELSTNTMMDQRLEYLHQNPVRAGLVREPEHYVYSSALDYAGGKGLLPIEFLE
ncbi:REP element-mobilizing transposase RayT [Catalinimonas alkaloidigena]|uniref:REP element-mobilizing transposase RayT n=1 Tax=Catalinimonas alkaloidigena TaxID=1075417 RepID=A0A1G9QG43_9BACT|nr:transposase [Catalinimonas alkaloidigena]SDM09989.1 REP element-mobilizing transposase RayT [Catalinimonas alkaloidigena]